jgi:hypothetical protein
MLYPVSMRNTKSKCMEIKIAPNKRFTFIGKTRSGKSFLAWYLLRIFSQDPDRQIIFIDPKHEHRKFGDGSSIDKPKLVNKYDPKAHVQIFQEYEWNDELEKMSVSVLKRGKAIVVLDELGGIATANSVPSGVVRLWTQGGGKDVGSWAMLQYPKRTPKVIKSQTELFFIFRINSQDDRHDLLDFITDRRIMTNKIPLHQFWIFSDDMDSAVLCKPIEVKASKIQR